jgi:hypothetical protein
MTMEVDGMFDEESMHGRAGRWRERSAGGKARFIAGWMALAAAGLALIGLVLMLLWNRVMSGILGLPALGYLDAICLFVLLRICLGGRGSSFIGRMRMRRAMRERMARRMRGEEAQAE